MATIFPMPSGKYRAQVYVSGVRDSRVFRTRREAQQWAAIRENELRKNKLKPKAEIFTLGQAMDKYAAEVSPEKRGGKWEIVRLFAMKKILPVEDTLANVGPDAINAYRDKRLREVSRATVLRELGILSSVFETARMDWRWIESNPVREIRKPAKPAHRTVTISPDQVGRMLSTMGYSPSGRIASVSGAVAVCFLLALRTGCRAGELCALRWNDVAADRFHVDSKTPAGNRDIPTTPKTRRLIEKMRGFDPVSVFGMAPRSLDALFRRYRQRAGLSGFTFHDTRHTAATRVVARSAVNVLELCKLFGWADPKYAMIYFNPSVQDLARRLAERR
jgi:integrase